MVVDGLIGGGFDRLINSGFDGFDLRLMGLIWFWFHMGLMG